MSISRRALDRTGSTKSDPVESAARSLRGIEREQQRYRRNRSAIRVSAIVLGVCGAAAVITGFVADAEVGAWILTVAVLGAAGLNYAVSLYGAAVMVASMVAAAGTTVAVGVHFGIGVGQLVAVGAIAVATWIVGTSRRLRFPRTPSVVAAQWCVPVCVAMAGVLGHAAAISLALVGTGAAAALSIDVGTVIAARRASKRSGIPMNPGSNLARNLIGFVEPPSMDAHNLQAGISAEQQTAAELARLGPEWTVLHSRSLPGTNADVDHVVIGPPGVLVVDSKHRNGVLTYSGDVGHTPERRQIDELFGAATGEHSWTLNGRDATFIAESSVFEAACIDDLLAMPPDRLVTPTVLAVHGATMNSVSGPMDVATDGGFQTQVQIVAGPHIASYLRSLPTLGRPAEFIADLAVVVDYLLPPK
ncbi:nuclease-related domain-containing protein [Rhodococcus qingshengii]|nr:nuclease-related domain-containing protein [Rhodococcus qingshengii]